MQYLGGKKKQSKAICTFLEAQRRPAQPFYDVFCGMASIVAGMSGERYAFDASQALVTLLEAAQAGWQPPGEITEDQYKQIKAARDPNDPLTAFVGFGCSYGGKYFGGYARDLQHGRNFAGTAGRSLAKIIAQCEASPRRGKVRFACSDYRVIVIPDGAMVYCDPPYGDTTIAYDCEPFDVDDFWRWAAELSQRCDVFVSEYTAPREWSCEWSAEVRKSRFAGVKVERIFRLR